MPSRDDPLFRIGLSVPQRGWSVGLSAVVRSSPLSIERGDLLLPFSSGSDFAESSELSRDTARSELRWVPADSAQLGVASPGGFQPLNVFAIP